MSKGWESEIVEVAEAFAAARPGDDGTCLLALHEVLGAAPAPVAAALGAPCDGQRARHLARGDCTHELAFALTGRAGLMVSRSPSGEAEATLVAHGLFDEISCAAASVPLAIGGALAAGLVAWSAAARQPAISRARH